MRLETDNVGYPIVPLVPQLVAMCGDAGGYLHWGATRQDIMDTANALQVRAALEIVESDLGELRAILRDLAARYRDTPMAGRTHLQHALPITFGYKARHLAGHVRPTPGTPGGALRSPARRPAGYIGSPAHQTTHRRS